MGGKAERRAAAGGDGLGGQLRGGRSNKTIGRSAAEGRPGASTRCSTSGHDALNLPPARPPARATSATAARRVLLCCASHVVRYMLDALGGVQCNAQQCSGAEATAWVRSGCREESVVPVVVTRCVGHARNRHHKLVSCTQFYTVRTNRRTDPLTQPAPKSVCVQAYST